MVGRSILTNINPSSAEKWAGKSSGIPLRAKRQGGTKTKPCRSETDGVSLAARPSSSWTRPDPQDHPLTPYGLAHDSSVEGRSSGQTARPTSSLKQELAIHSPSNSLELGVKTPRSFESSPAGGESRSRAFFTNIRRSKAVAPTSSSRRTVNVKKLIEKRISTLGIRIRVQERRRALRNKRESVMDRDAQFTQDLRILAARTSNPELKALLGRYIDIQNFREEVQFQETEYNVLEDQLIRNEWELEENETKLYQELERAGHRSRSGDAASLSNSDAGYSALSESLLSAPSIVNPLKQQWYSRVGDRNLVLERLQELHAERAHWVEEERVRQRVGRSLGEDARSFLDSFDTRVKNLQQDLAQIEADISGLQEGISEQADILYSSSQFDREVETTDESQAGSILSSINSDDADFATKDPLFLRIDEAHPDPVFRNVVVEANQEPISTVSYINEWLLHILRRSAIEVRRFKMTEKLGTLPLSPERLKQLVLEWWSKDDTVKLFFSARNNTAMSVSISSRTKEQEFTSKFKGGDSVVSTGDRITLGRQGARSLLFDGATIMARSPASGN